MGGGWRNQSGKFCQRSEPISLFLCLMLRHGDTMSETLNLAQKLKSEGEKLPAFFSGLTDAQWTKEVYTEGAVWSIRNILAHLMMSEGSLVRLFERIRQGGEGVAEDFEIDRYNAHQQEKAKELTPPELLEQYKSHARENGRMGFGYERFGFRKNRKASVSWHHNIARDDQDDLYP